MHTIVQMANTIFKIDYSTPLTHADYIARVVGGKTERSRRRFIMFHAIFNGVLIDLFYYGLSTLCGLFNAETFWIGE